jgi:UDP-glucuronate 4-epimerase
MTEALTELNDSIARRDWRTVVRVARLVEEQALTALRTLRTHALSARGPLDPRHALVTGGAGFIGAHLVRRLLERGRTVIVIDDFNDYYDPVEKYENLAPLLPNPALFVYEADLRDLPLLRTILSRHTLDVIVHLGARAGVRPSLIDPQLYVTTNVAGTQNLLDLAREHSVKAFVYASSSSVYGGSTDFPFRESQSVDRPISPYAATKRANEVQASCYGRLYGLPVTGLRFFTVYGPSGRPDMAVRLFFEALADGKPVTVFGDGGSERDFTYIDDIIDGIEGALSASYGKQGWDEICNLGESDTTSVRELLLLIARELGLIETPPIKDLDVQAEQQLFGQLDARGLVRLKPMQLGDVPRTFADITKARSVLGYAPRTRITDGIRLTADWQRALRARGSDPVRKPLLAALRRYSRQHSHAGLDSLGAWRDPAHEPERAKEVVGALDSLVAYQQHAADDRLALRTQAGLAALLQDIAAYLGAGAGAHTGLAAHQAWRQARQAAGQLAWGASSHF